jgi:hypothetical protein
MKRPQDEGPLSPEEGAALIERLERQALTADARRLLVPVGRWLFWLLWVVQEAKLSLKRLRTLVLGKSSPPSQEARSEGLAVGGEVEQGRGAAPVEASAAAPRAAAPRPPAQGGEARGRRGHRPGQGRHGATASAGAERVVGRHEALRVGEVCPGCGHGRLYAVLPGGEIRLDGKARLSASRYELEKLRCSACGRVFTAPLPGEAGEEQYSPRARAVLAVRRYDLGLPLSRLEGYQAMVGVPVPDATQWEQIARVADCASVVFEPRECLAAQGELLSQDDTTVRILSLLGENLQRRAPAEARGFSRPTARPGMDTTALVVQVGEPPICLYDAGRAPAGEHPQAWLLHRQADRDKPLVMSDALAHKAADDETTLRRCHCLAPGRRQFSERAAVVPPECQGGIAALQQVFAHDQQARGAQRRPEARWAYHQD